MSNLPKSSLGVMLSSLLLMNSNELCAAVCRERSGGIVITICKVRELLKDIGSSSRRERIMTICHRTLALALCGLMFEACPKLHASMPESGGIVITILEGEGALNDIRQRTAREPIVQVEDENHRPIADAAVVFLLPGSGPGGSFSNGELKLSTVTDSNGKAVAKGFQPNNVAGEFQIQVVVTVSGRIAKATIHQQNAKSPNSGDNNHSSSPAKPIHAVPVKWILILGGAAAGGAAAAIIATSGSNPTVISAGPPTVGPPPALRGGIKIQLHFHEH